MSDRSLIAVPAAGTPVRTGAGIRAVAVLAAVALATPYAAAAAAGISGAFAPPAPLPAVAGVDVPLATFVPLAVPGQHVHGGRAHPAGNRLRAATRQVGAPAAPRPVGLARPVLAAPSSYPAPGAAAPLAAAAASAPVVQEIAPPPPPPPPVIETVTEATAPVPAAPAPAGQGAGGAGPRPTTVTESTTGGGAAPALAGSAPESASAGSAAPADVPASAPASAVTLTPTAAPAPAPTPAPTPASAPVAPTDSAPADPAAADSAPASDAPAGAAPPVAAAPSAAAPAAPPPSDPPPTTAPAAAGGQDGGAGGPDSSGSAAPPPPPSVSATATPAGPAQAATAAPAAAPISASPTSAAPAATVAPAPVPVPGATDVAPAPRAPAATATVAAAAGVTAANLPAAGASAGPAAAAPASGAPAAVLAPSLDNRTAGPAAIAPVSSPSTTAAMPAAAGGAAAPGSTVPPDVPVASVALAAPTQPAASVVRLAAAPTAPLDPAAVPGSGPSPPAVSNLAATSGSQTSTCGCLRGRALVSATVTAGTGNLVQVDLQFASDGTGQWSTLSTTTFADPLTRSYNLAYRWSLGAVPSGAYDLRVVATDDLGQTGIGVLRDQLVTNFNLAANTFAYSVRLAPVTPPLYRTVTLSTVVDPQAVPYRLPASVTFVAAPAGTDDFRPIGTAVTQVDGFGTPQASSIALTFDSSVLADGLWDFHVTAPTETPTDTGNGNTYIYVGGYLRGVAIDNAPPAIVLADPGRTLAGVVGLTATASDPSVGVDAVQFQFEPAGLTSWQTAAIALSAPYTARLDTRSLRNGVYAVRAVAYNNVGNSAASTAYGNVTVANAPEPDYGAFTATSYVSPVDGGLTVFGEVAGSPTGEAWAYGISSAQGAVLDGQPIPFTSPGHQLVLARFRSGVGWVVADVLRDASGAPFTGTCGIASCPIAAAMAPSGEAWLVVSATLAGVAGQYVFHRSPGSIFALDPAATAALAPIAADGGDLRLHQAADGTVSGLYVSPGQVTLPAVVPGASGPPATVQTQLRFGALAGGAWAVASAPLPGGFTAQAADETVTLAVADPTGPGSGWAGLRTTAGAGTFRQPLLLARFGPTGWAYAGRSGFDALDLTARYAALPARVDVDQLRASDGGVWLEATTTLNQTGNQVARFVAYLDAGEGRITQTYCDDAGGPAPSYGCLAGSDAIHPARSPGATFETPDGTVVYGTPTAGGPLTVNVNGSWTAANVPAAQMFSLDSGWTPGTAALLRISRTPPPSPLAPYPQPNRSTLVSVALPPGQVDAGAGGALAVGLGGTALHYDAAAGWLVDPVPRRARRAILSAVAFAGPGSAFAVGQAGIILHWDGATWSLDPASSVAATASLTAVAFAADGTGWAVGDRGTILRYDGTAWTPESLLDSGAVTAVDDLTSVAVAGGEVYAVAAGHLVTRHADGTWGPVDPRLLPQPIPPDGTVKVVAGLPDGGLVVAGRGATPASGVSYSGYVLERNRPGEPLVRSDQPITGVPIALAPFRDGSGRLRTFVALGLPAYDPNATGVAATADVAGSPAGDGDLIEETAAGWVDLSRSQQTVTSQPGDISVLHDAKPHPDPVLAVATAPTGGSAWAVGGWAGTFTASAQGSALPLSARSPTWQTAAIWRFDAGGPVPAPTLAPSSTAIPAAPGAVTFAFFSGPECVDSASCAVDPLVQPNVNLQAAAAEIAAHSAQPGGPSFAVFGGNARGPIDPSHGPVSAAALGALPRFLSGLAALPLFATAGRDDRSVGPDPLRPFADAFSGAPAPFGPGTPPDGITPVSAGNLVAGEIHTYYSFDVTQNGGTLRVIVLDDSAGSLERSAAGQQAWLDGQLAAANAAGLTTVVVSGEPLAASTAPGKVDPLASELVAAGVSAVFAGAGYAGGASAGGAAIGPGKNQLLRIPYTVDPTVATIPEYLSASLGYQQDANNGVVWYLTSVDTVTGTVSVQAIPVIQSLAIKPELGLAVDRSKVLTFSGIGRRPPGAAAGSDGAPGIDQYVEIPASGCSGCIVPSYTFASSDPTIGDFVAPSGPGSLFPLLNAAGRPVHSATSGLFCAYNPGTVTISLTAGLLTASLPVTVRPGAVSTPCGTVVPRYPTNAVVVPSGSVKRVNVPITNPEQGLSAPAIAPTAVATAPVTIPPIVVPPLPVPVVSPTPAPPPVVAPAPAPPLPAGSPLPASYPLPPSAPTGFVELPTVALPPIPPAVTPVPPGGATASAQASARREEKARKHASQSAFTIRPAGVSAADYFFPAVVVVSVLAALLIAGGLAGPRPGRARLAWAPANARNRSRKRRP